jgi:ketosteroid isomerase-like protein
MALNELKGRIKMSASRAVALFAILIVCVACASEPPPPIIDLQVEEQRIRELTHDWYDAENQKDLDAVMGFMADGMVAEFPGVPLIEGKEALRSVMATMLESIVSIAGDRMTIVVSGDGTMAYQFGTSRGVFQGPDGEVTVAR